MNPLQENIDYYIENGLYVFTRTFHLKRGYCCKSGCKHCPYGYFQPPPARVLSLVPSWTETLIECGVQVVGRTRFCIHPASAIENIPVVGGTKKINWDKLTEIHPQLIIVDKEENTLEIAEQLTVPLYISHILHLNNMSAACLQLAEKLQNSQLLTLASRWRTIANHSPLNFNSQQIPGVIEWIKTPTLKITHIVYIIWQDPWMSVSGNSFIGSVIKKIGLSNYFEDSEVTYPTFDLNDIPANTLLLFSSEPFPFQRNISVLKSLPYASAIVNGESYSWFGVRSLQFLESLFSL